MKFNINRDRYGRYQKKNIFLKGIAISAILVTATLGTLKGISDAHAGSGNNDSNIAHVSGSSVDSNSEGVETDCRKSESGDYDCTPFWFYKAFFEKHVRWYTESEIKEAARKQESPVSILFRVCSSKGFEGDECPKTLFGMAMQESTFGKKMVGDGGESQGYFHIMSYHKVPKSCSYDLECSAKWTLDRMIRYGYRTNPDRAVMAHNGTPNSPATLQYLALVNAKKAYWPGN